MENVPDHGFDEIEEGVEACLTCEIKMDTTGGQSPRDVAKRTAETLRKLAAAIETGAFDTGFAPILGTDGEKVGEL